MIDSLVPSWELAFASLINDPLSVMQVEFTSDADARPDVVKCHNCLNTCISMKPPALTWQTFRYTDSYAMGSTSSLVAHHTLKRYGRSRSGAYAPAFRDLLHVQSSVEV